MRQPRIALMESPGATKFNLETLRRIASAFDIALTVKFVPFSELRKWSDDFSPDDFNVSSFIDETPPQPESAKETENGQARSR
jgi:hypothetical protein